MHPIRVLIVDDHTILREGLRYLLAREPDIEVVGEAGDGLQAVRLAKKLQPDVIVMDIEMPHLDGIEATRAVRTAHPTIEILALSMHQESGLVFAMLKAGARGYLLKDAAGTELVNGVRAVARGETFLHIAVATLLVERASQMDVPRTTGDELTLRERDIFSMIADGFTSREIAVRLSLSAKTIDNCRATILEKLQARNKAEAITIGLQRGLIHTDRVGAAVVGSLHPDGRLLPIVA